MKKILKSMLLIVAAGFCATGVAQESKPFGMTMGMSKQEVIKALKGTRITEINEMSFMSGTAIERSSFFTRYIYTITPETGLCLVSSLSDGFTGISSVMQRYRVVKEALTSKYGQTSMSVERGVNTTFPIRPAIDQGFTEIADMWGVKADKNGKPQYTAVSDTLLYLALGVSPSGDNEAVVILTYAFRNFEKCNEIMIKNNAKGL